MVHLKLLGGISLETPTGPVTGAAAQRRRLALLARLALAGGQGVSRDTLIAALWPEQTADRGRHLLSDSLYRINQALGADAVLAVGDQLRINPAVLQSDVAEFEAARSAQDHTRAVELYRGPLLDGFHLEGAAELDQWFSAERARLADAVAAALESLAEGAEARGAHPEAVRHWRRLAAMDPLSSRVALRLVQAMLAAGDRAAALQQANTHAALLAAELDEDAAGEFRASVGALAASRAAPVPELEPSAVALPPGAPPPLARPPKSRGHRWRAIGAGLLVLLVALAVWASRPPSEPVTLAVLPFTDLSSAGDQQYLAAGVTEELISALDGVEGLQVASRTSVFALAGRGIDTRQLGQRLGATHVVEGSVRVEDGQLRIAVRLAGAADGVQLWTRQYDRRLADVLTVQKEVAGAIAQALRLRLRGEAGGAEDAPAVDPEVYRLYLQGRHAWHQRTAPSLRAAVAAFAEAVRLAPDYSRAWLGLGDAYAVLGFYDWLPPHEAFPEARDAARRAHADPATRGEAEALLGYVALYYEWDLEAAGRHFETALRLEPASSKVRQWYANYLTAAGRFTAAERAMREAQVLEPLSLIANAALCWSYHLGRRPAEAVAQCRATRTLDSTFALAWLWEGWAWSARVEWDSAAAALARLLAAPDPGVQPRAAMAVVAGGRGNAAEARRLYDDLVAERRGGYVSAYELARAALGAGLRAEALDWLETARGDRAHAMVFLRWDPQMDPLRGEPRFDALVRSVGRGGGAGG